LEQAVHAKMTGRPPGIGYDPLPMAEERALRRLLPLLLIAVAAIGFVAAGGHHYLSFALLAENRDRLKALVVGWGLVAPLAYVGLYTSLAALSVPGAALMTIAGGFLFGPWLGTLYAVLGATLGATILFLAARAGLAGLTKRAGPFVAKLEAGFRRDAFNYLLFLRLVPIFPFWLVNLVPAILGVPLRTFVVATLIGIVPGGLVYASLGHGLGVVAGEPDLGVLMRPAVLGPVLGLAVLSLLPVAYRRLRGRHHA
jgi:uncharacterized membrane protein YdjX (TVP38/TMEM64 family)